MITHLRVVLPLWFLFLLLTANFELSNVAIGLVLAVVVSSLTQRNVAWINFRQLPGTLLELGREFVLVVYELFIGGIQVVQILFTPSLPNKTGQIVNIAEDEFEVATTLRADVMISSTEKRPVETGGEKMINAHVLDVWSAEKQAEGV